MTDADRGTFDRAFGRVCGAFRLKLSTHEREELGQTYFRVLEAFELEAVVAAGRIVLEKYKKFPTIADWLAEMQAPAIHARPAAAADVRTWTASEREAYQQAAAWRFEAAACDCLECQAAGVTARALRFVPTLAGGVEERAYDELHQTLVIVGHWAHGLELDRWYVARDAFFALAHRHDGIPVVELVGAGAREPGEDD